MEEGGPRIRLLAKIGNMSEGNKMRFARIIRAVLADTAYALH